MIANGDVYSKTFAGININITKCNMNNINITKCNMNNINITKYNMKNMSFKISDELKEQANEYARRKWLTLSILIRTLLIKEIKEINENN